MGRGAAVRAALGRLTLGKAARILAWTLGGLLAIPVAFLIFAAVLGTIPRNWGWQEAESGVTIFIRSNGVHTWIVMPKVAHGVDWRPYSLPEHLRDARHGASDHVAIGYGNREFYLDTPTWNDLSVRTAFAAFFGNGRTLLHVEHTHAPEANEWQRPITLTADEYRRLASFVSRRFELDARGRTIPVLGRGYGRSDMFYEANGGYSFVLTCNEWTGRALRRAGVRTGVWTPLEQSIMWRLD